MIQSAAQIGRTGADDATTLLQAGVDIAVIVVWLAHESTNVYVHANLAMKEKALARMQPMDTIPTIPSDDRLLAFLESL